MQTEFALQLTVECGLPVEFGPSGHGQRRFIPISGGRFSGPRINGEVLPGGGDWQLQRSDGVLEIEARYNLRAEDGSIISVLNRGITVRSPHEWLNRMLFIGTVQLIGRDPLTVLVSAFTVI